MAWHTGENSYPYILSSSEFERFDGSHPEYGSAANETCNSCNQRIVSSIEMEVIDFIITV